MLQQLAILCFSPQQTPKSTGDSKFHEMWYKKFELMLTIRVKAYSSSGSVI